MAYVVVVFAIINSAFLVAVALGFMALREDLLTSVETAVGDEVRKQDDRIEKRLAKVQGSAGTAEEDGVMHNVSPGPMEVGRPYRR